MIKPRLDKLLEPVDSHYAGVIVAAKRARQINSYYHNLGEGTFDEYPPPMVETGSKNYLKIALEEIAAGKSSTATARATWPGSCSESPAGSPPTRRLSSFGSRSRPGHSVRVIQTPASLHFVGRATFEGVTGAPVLVDEWEPDPARGAFPGDPAPDHDPISHLALVERCDVLCVAPASANTIAKLAHGLADNLLTSAALANRAPLVLAPAMNNRMYEHPATQHNLEILRERGARIAEPGTGSLASRGEWGVGPAGRAAGDPEPYRGGARGGRVQAALDGRPESAGHRRRHPRADRLRPLRGQPLVGSHGSRARRGGGAPGRRGDPGVRERRAAAAGVGPLARRGDERRARSRR